MSSRRAPKQNSRIAALLVVAVGVNSCALPFRDCESQGLVCVGLVTGYGDVDAGIERQAWLGLQDARGAGEVGRIDYIVTTDTRDRAANIAYFADAGYDIVVTTGGGALDETTAAANAYPAVLFVLVQPPHESPATPSNIVKIEFQEEHAGFLAGAAAARLSHTRYVAAVCEARYIDYVERYCEGFSAGVTFIDPQVHAEIVYRVGDSESLFHDVEWGRESASRAIEQGADVLFAVGEQTAIAALEQASHDGILVIAAQTDMSEETSELRELLVTSATLEVRQSLLALIRSHLRGQLPGGTFWGTVRLAPFRDYADRLPPGVGAELLRLEADLNADILEFDFPFHEP